MGSVTINNHCESENAALAKDLNGPKPNHSLHVSFDSIVEHTDKRLVSFGMYFYAKIYFIAYKSFECIFTQKHILLRTNHSYFFKFNLLFINRYNTIEKEGMDQYESSALVKNSDTENDIKRKKLYKIVVKRRVDQCFQQWNIAKDFRFMQNDLKEDANGVVRIGYLVRKFSFAKWDDECDPKPSYIRTRRVTVTLVLEDEQLYANFICDCGMYLCEMHPCRHIYAIIRNDPNANHFFPETLKSYELFYNKDDDYTAKVKKSRSLIKKHGGVLMKEYVENGLVLCCS